MLKNRPLTYVAIVFLLGLILGKIVFPDKVFQPGTTKYSLTGVICSEPQSRNNSQSFLLKVKSLGKVWVRVLARTPELEYGDLIKVNAVLIPHEPATNPAVSSFKNYLHTKEIYYKAEVEFSQVTPIAKGHGNKLLNLAIWLKHKLVPITQKTLPTPYNTLLGSIIFGTSAVPMPSHIQETYKRAGVIHLLVVSGSQIALLVGICLRICQALRLSNLAIFLIVSFFNILFTLMTGADPSIMRACIMAEIALTGKLLQRDPDIYTTMAFAALISSVMNPYIIFNVGFQLSFMATWSLVYLVPPLEDCLEKKLPNFLVSPLAIALAPTLATTPLTLYYFSAWSAVSLLMNLIVISWVEILVVLGFLATLLGIIWLPLAMIINGTNFVLLFILHKLVTFFAQLPFAYIFIKSPHWIFVMAYYGLLVVGIEKMQEWTHKKDGNNSGQKMACDLSPYSTTKQKKNWVIAGVIIASLIFFVLILEKKTATPITLGKEQLVITMIDVGQGDSFLIETPQGKKVLVDAGSAWGGKRAVVPVLQHKGINTLDCLIGTHIHADHIGGFPGLLQQFKPKLIIGTEPMGNKVTDKTSAKYGNWFFREYRKIIKKKKIPYKNAMAGQVIKLSKDITMHVLHPSKPYLTDTPSNDNENSVVLYLTYKKFSILLTGDLGKIGEQKILERMNNKQPPFDRLSTIKSVVLKLGHHGSKHSTSKGWLEEVAPQVVLVSCKKKNRYNHPHPSVITNMRKKNIKIYRTDLQGAVIIRTDGNKYLIETVL